MFSKLLTLAVIIGACYWYWSGPYQERLNPGIEKRLEINTRNMRECIYGLNYKAGSTGESEGNPQEACAEKFNLYQHEGQWHSYDDIRPDE